MAKKTASKSTKTCTKTTAKAKLKKSDVGNGKPAPKKATLEKQAKSTPAASPEPKADKVKATSRARDPRLPGPGTVLQKKDRQGAVRCECTVEQDGIRYQGTLYRSLSAAAMAASKDMGLGGRAQNGFLFWGLIRQPPRETDSVAVLEKAWARYEARAKGIIETSLDDEAKAKVLSTLRKHTAALEGLQGRVA